MANKRKKATSKQVRRYATEAARASKGMKKTPDTRRRTVSRRNADGTVTHRGGKKVPGKIVKDTRSENSRRYDARKAMTGTGARAGSAGSAASKVRLLAAPKISSAKRAIRKATTGSAGQGSGSRKSLKIKNSKKNRG